MVESPKSLIEELPKNVGQNKKGKQEVLYGQVRKEDFLYKPRKNLNKNLNRANKAKKDEFYTQLSDIENELKNYKDQMRGKIIYCNCDDPFESNFFKYFASNFNILGLKKLITTSYVDSPIVGGQLKLFDIAGLKPKGKEPFKIEITEVKDLNKDGATGLVDVELLLKSNKNASSTLKGNGDFRSEECIKLLKEADIVATNPPFSLFREYIAQLIEHKKKFLIIGNMNAVSYKDIFKLIKENKIWIGYSPRGMNFVTPEGNLKNVNTCWFTNLDVSKRHEKLQLYKKYSREEYSTYDNYDAIEVSKVSEIPADYSGIMGVPVTFLDKHNPEQFEIIGIDRYVKDNPNYGRRFTLNGKETYARILIKPKNIKSKK